MKEAYPIIIKASSACYWAAIPDFEITAQGDSVAETMENAREAIGMRGCYLEDKKIQLPQPSRPRDQQLGPDEIVTLVDVDFEAFRRRHESRTVRKNLSLPSWLNEEGERVGVNFSGILQEALIKELKIGE